MVKFYPTGSVSLDRNGGLSQNGSADSDSLSTLSLTLDRNMNYRRRIKHISPVLSRVELSGFNAIQTLVIIVEFIQLASFPVRDLYRNDAFQLALQLPQGTFSKDFMALIRSALAIFSTGLPNVDFDYVKFVICWWLTIAAVCIAGIFIAGYYAIRSEWVLRKLDSMQKTKNFLTSVDATWILSFLPIVNLLYLVILNAFLERLGCLSSNITPTWPAPLEELGLAIQKRQSECLPIYSAYPMMHTAYSLVGFTLAFFIFTACRTAQEPKPEDGIINYTSNSELLLKSGAIIILLLYTLVPTSATATVRGSLAAIIISLMILYNVVIGSTYSRWINFLRTLSFLAVLWMSLVVTYYTAENQFLELYNTGSGVWNVVVIGWCVVWAAYSLLYYFVVMKWEDTCHKSSDMNSLPRSDKSEPFDAADQSSGEDNPRQINVIVENSKNSMGRNGKELRQNLSFTSLNSDIGSPGRYRAAGRPAPYSNDQRASLDKNSAGGTSDSSTNVNMTLI